MISCGLRCFLYWLYIVCGCSLELCFMWVCAVLTTCFLCGFWFVGFIAFWLLVVDLCWVQMFCGFVYFVVLGELCLRVFVLWVLFTWFGVFEHFGFWLGFVLISILWFPVIAGVLGIVWVLFVDCWGFVVYFVVCVVVTNFLWVALCLSVVLGFDEGLV